MNSDVKIGSTSTASGEIAWKQVGSGPPLLVVNGYAATKDDWDPTFLGSLADASTLICPDNRGIGDSLEAFDDGEGLSVETMGADAITVLDDLGIESVSVVGWSMGGFIAQQVAAEIPDRVESLVLLGTDPGGHLATHGAKEDFARLVDHSGTPMEQAERLLNLLFPPEFAEAALNEVGDLVAAAQANLPQATLDAQQLAMRGWYKASAEDRLARIAAPVLAAAGSEDIVIPPENAELFTEHLSNSWLARFPGCGHAFMAQEPKRLGALITTFLGR